MELTGYDTLRVTDAGTLVTAVLDRPAQQNALDAAMLGELARVLDHAERAPECRALVIDGEGGVFCTGMDFAETANVSGAYMTLLGRFAQSKRIVVSVVDGRATGGGVGLAAASDLVVASARAEFSLPEALWGLVPCCVLPYVIRRVGFQRAYRMALTTQAVGAEQALDWALADVVDAQPRDAVRRLLLRSVRVQEDAVADLKRYARSLSGITPAIEEAAVQEITRLLALPRVRQAIAALGDPRLPSGGRRDG